MTTLYAGPGKVNFNAIGLFAEGENGAVIAAIEQGKDDIAASSFGRVSAAQADAIAKISLTPFSNWGNLATLFPPYIGASVGATAGVLLIGKRPHDGGDVPAKIWAQADGRLYTFPRCAITKHPDLHLGVGKPFFGPMEITGVGATGISMGSAGWLYTILESGGGFPAADPGGNFTLADFVQGEWKGAYGTSPTGPAGFGADGGSSIEAEDEWTITSAVKYSPLKVQGLTRTYKLDSVEFMAKCRPYGPTHTQIDAVVGLNSSRILGSRFASAGTALDLVLTGPLGKTITLKNADVMWGGGFEFGGNKLGTGEIGFINGTTFSGTPALPQPLIVFSA